MSKSLLEKYTEDNYIDIGGWDDKEKEFLFSMLTHLFELVHHIHEDHRKYEKINSMVIKSLNALESMEKTTNEVIVLLNDWTKMLSDSVMELDKSTKTIPKLEKFRTEYEPKLLALTKIIENRTKEVRKELEKGR